MMTDTIKTPQVESQGFFPGRSLALEAYDGVVLRRLPELEARFEAFFLLPIPIPPHFAGTKLAGARSSLRPARPDA